MTIRAEAIVTAKSLVPIITLLSVAACAAESAKSPEPIRPVPAAESNVRDLERSPDHDSQASDAYNCQGRCYVQKIWYVTDREKSAGATPETTFSADRGQLQFGSCVVTIPADHVTGELESPSIWRLEFHQDPNRHVVLANVTPLTLADFHQGVDVSVESSPEKAVLIFVHGFNVTFAEAARRTAQVAYDLNFRGGNSRGTAIFYSWPSQGGVIPYTVDENNADWTEGDLSTFLVDFLRSSGAGRVYVLAHSMGSRPTLRALKDLVVDHPELAARVSGFILAAPDFDADIFRNQIAPALEGAHLPGTLYVSSKDMALEASKRVHRYVRLGDTSAGPVVVPGLDTIDATLVDDGDFLGHGYYASKLLQDLFTLVTVGTPPKDRFGIEAIHAPSGDYWRIRAQ